MKDILTIDDIRLLVNSFYDNVRKDELLAGIFNDVIQNNWPQHLDKMYRFWQTVLLEEHTYLGSPFAPHSGLPVEQQHFDRWLELFHQTIDNLFTGEKAEEARWRSTRMAEMFSYKLFYGRGTNMKPIQ